MPNEPGKAHYRRYPIKPLSGGLNDALNPALLEDGQTPDCENVDFDAESVQGHGGAIKFNNQPAPHSGLLTKVSMAPLSLAAGVSVPQRGYGFLPYARETDLGGDFALAGTALNPSTHTFHGRRGRSFTFTVGFRLPLEERLYVPKAGAGAPGSAAADISSYDEGLEECTLIAQKGGDAYSPLSWALGIVNTGDVFELVTGASAFDRVSNYALVFMWYDGPGWGAWSCGQMRYLVGAGGANVGTTGRYCTMGLRALIAKAFIEPGRDYQVSVSLRLDSGSAGDGTAADPTAAWNQDGLFEIVLRDPLGNVTRCATSGTDVFSWKGPADNYDYLTRYGVRFSGRDPMFLGLGMRFAPWAEQGFAPFGLDSASMESGGFRMVDVSAIDSPTTYPAGQWCTAGVGATYVAINLRGMHNSGAANLPNPYDPTELASASPWPGLYDTGLAGIPNQGTANQSEALRNCWVVIWGAPAGTQPAAVRGARIRISHYTEAGGTFRLVRADGLVTTGWATQAEFFVIVFRWHQRPLRISSFRIWGARRDHTDERVLFSMGSYTLESDQAEPDVSSLIANWLLDDAGGGVLRETVRGLTGYLAPYALGSTRDRGLFLSGEGEALVLDFAEDPVLRRELLEMLRSGSSGFAIEIACVMPQAYYARELVGVTERVAVGAPVLASWELRDDDPGLTVAPRPLLRLSHRARIDAALGTGPFSFPQGFTLEADTLDDQDAGEASVAVAPWTTGPVVKWSTSAEWVGEPLRIQVGVQSTGVADEYEVYMAATPKSVLNPASGDPSNAEFAYVATLTIARRDLVRSVVTVGGAWRPDQFGYSELNARMIVSDVRVYGCAAPGALPALNGDVVPKGTGKLLGARCLPPGPLSSADLLRPVGASGGGVNVTRESAAVTPASGLRFFVAEPEATLDAAKETFLLVADDTLEVWVDDTIPTEVREFYYVASVASGGTSLTLSRPFDGATMKNVAASTFRVIGYTSFDDDLSYVRLQTTLGSPFVAGSATPDDAAMTPDVFRNLAPTGAAWSLRTYSPAVLALDIAPEWTRAPSVPRRNPVLGMKSHRGALYAATRGALYLADDRWRIDGPTDTIKRSLHVLGRAVPRSGALAPLEADAIRFDSAAGLEITAARLAAGGFAVDAWVKLDGYGDLQTVLWVGSLSTNPMRNASGSAGQHKVHLWLRLAGGAPELAIGSTAAYSGTSRPDGGLFVARAGGQVPLGEWTHLRFVVEGAQSNTWLSSTVRCFINGRTVNTRLLASENAAPAGAWISLANMVTASGCSALVGVARDSYAEPAAARTFVEDVLDGDVLPPDRLHGRIHALDGRIARVAAFAGAASAAFQPHALTYSSPTFLTLDAPEGVGHKCYDSAGAQYGVIESHPAVSLFHEMSTHDNPASWALYGAALFVTTGGRPVYVRG